jgi:gas vesicle protein
METLIRYLMKMLESITAKISSDAPLDIKAALSSTFDAAMSSEVTEILTDMSDLLAQGFNQLQSRIKQLQNDYQEKPELLKQDHLQQEIHEESKE